MHLYLIHITPDYAKQPPPVPASRRAGWLSQVHPGLLPPLRRHVCSERRLRRGFDWQVCTVCAGPVPPAAPVEAETGWVCRPVHRLSQMPGLAGSSWVPWILPGEYTRMNVYCVLHDCVLHECVLHECVLNECVLHECVLHDCVLHECVLHECVLHECVLHECVLHECKLSTRRRVRVFNLARVLLHSCSCTNGLLPRTTRTGEMRGVPSWSLCAADAYSRGEYNQAVPGMYPHTSQSPQHTSQSPQHTSANDQ
jgi:hypothetical protein